MDRGNRDGVEASGRAHNCQSVSDGSATSGMEVREWKPWHGNEGLGLEMEKEGTGMEGM